MSKVTTYQRASGQALVSADDLHDTIACGHEPEEGRRGTEEKSGRDEKSGREGKKG